MQSKNQETQENKLVSAAARATKQEGEAPSPFTFEDNRPEALAQKKQIDAINSSPHIQQQRALQSPIASPTSPIQKKEAPGEKEEQATKESSEDHSLTANNISLSPPDLPKNNAAKAPTLQQRTLPPPFSLSNAHASHTATVQREIAPYRHKRTPNHSPDPQADILPFKLEKQVANNDSAQLQQAITNRMQEIQRSGISPASTSEKMVMPSAGIVQRRLLSPDSFITRLKLPEGFDELPEEQLKIRRIEIQRIREKLEEYQNLDTFETPQKALDIVNEIDSLINQWIMKTFVKRQKLGPSLDDNASFGELQEAMLWLRITDLTEEKQLLLSRIRVDTPEEQVKRNLEQIGREKRGATGPKETTTSEKIGSVGTPLTKLTGTGIPLASLFAKLAGEEQTSKNISNLGGSINDAASGVLSMITGLDTIAKGVKAQDGDPAEVATGSEQIFSGTMSAATSVGSLANAATKLANYIGGFAVVPLGGLISGPIKLSKGIADFAQHKGLHSAAKTGIESLKEQRKEKEALSLSLLHVQIRTIQLATHDALSIFSEGFGLVGTVLTVMGGPVAPAGAAIKTASTIASGINGVTKLLIDSYKASKAQEAERSYDKDELGAAGRLIKDHPLHAAQTIVEKARKSDPVAVAFMMEVGLKSKQIEESSDENIRRLILIKIDEVEDPKTILQKIGAIPSKITSFFSSKK